MLVRGNSDEPAGVAPEIKTGQRQADQRRPVASRRAA
jgi:hypothetical protein